MVKKEIEVIKNFLPKEQFLPLKNFMLSHEIPWYASRILGGKDLIYPDYNYQLVHIFYEYHLPQSPFIHILQDLIKKINPSAIVKIKANNSFKTNNKIEHGFHRDTVYNCTTAVYYMDNTNGETIFEDGTRIKSEENTFVCFPSHLSHSGSTNTCKEPNRILINLNYYES